MSRSFAELDAATTYAVLRLRQDVFVVEQECAYADIDGRDTEPGTRHLTLEDDDGEPVGYLRILDDGERARVGRVLLRRDRRGQGLSEQLVRAAVAEIGERDSVLDAQSPLAGWYAGFGYRVTGPEFLDDGILHLPMSRP